MAYEIGPTIEVKTVAGKDAPMMLHEQVCSGSLGDTEFTAIRDMTGLHWQIRIGDQTAMFSLTDALQEIVTQTVESKAAELTL